MNINAVIANPVKLPTVTPTKTANEIKPVEVKPERLISAEVQVSSAFYTREEEPWKDKSLRGVDNEADTGPIPSEAQTKWVEMKHGEAKLAFERQSKMFTDFMTDLRYTDPELTGKSWGYSLGVDGQIMILDPKENLTEHEIEYLTEAMNAHKGFTEMVQTHARIMMELVDHDVERFGGRYELNLMNFHKTIDYSKVGIPSKDPSLDWAKQIYENGERRKASLVNVKA